MMLLLVILERVGWRLERVMGSMGRVVMGFRGEKPGSGVHTGCRAITQRSYQASAPQHLMKWGGLTRFKVVSIRLFVSVAFGPTLSLAVLDIGRVAALLSLLSL